MWRNKRSSTGWFSPSTASNIYAAFAIRLLIVTGARFRGILTLQWANVHWEYRVLQLDSKTGFKYIFLNDYALAVLRGIPGVRPAICS